MAIHVIRAFCADGELLSVWHLSELPLDSSPICPFVHTVAFNRDCDIVPVVHNGVAFDLVVAGNTIHVICHIIVGIGESPLEIADDGLCVQGRALTGARIAGDVAIEASMVRTDAQSHHHILKLEVERFMVALAVLVKCVLVAVLAKGSSDAMKIAVAVALQELSRDGVFAGGVNQEGGARAIDRVVEGSVGRG